MLNKFAKIIFSRYNRSINRFIDSPHETQNKVLQNIVNHGINTLFGQKYNFDKIKDYNSFTNVPIHEYEDLKPYLNKIIVEKQNNVLWDSPVIWFAMSSGTTGDRSKYIPITKENLYNCHYKAGYYMLSRYLNNNINSNIFNGKSLVLGGSQQLNQIGTGFFTADISAILLKNLPFIAKKFKTPEAIALIPDWEEKLKKLIDYSKDKNITSLVGVPSWILVLLKRLTEVTNSSILDIWPNLEVFFHGGVSFMPFKVQYDNIIGADKINYWETYNASEGFFGVQYSDNSKDLLLLLDNDIFYEFIPENEWNDNNPKVIQLKDVSIGIQYALIISTSSGLWRYKIGDTIEFTSLNPYLFKITGRTKQFINAFGEELIVENADKAIYEACLYTKTNIVDYTVAPFYSDNKNNGAHEWIIEFVNPPDDIDNFTLILDEELKKVNSDYNAKRSYNLSLGLPIVHSVANGTFYEWMKTKQKLGGQNKVPKLSNNRNYLDDILSYISTKK